MTLRISKTLNRQSDVPLCSKMCYHTRRGIPIKKEVYYGLYRYRFEVRTVSHLV